MVSARAGGAHAPEPRHSNAVRHNRPTKRFVGDMPRAAASRAIRVGDSAFLEQGVEKSVVIVLCVAHHWQELAVGRAERGRAVETRASRVGMAGKGRASWLYVLGPTQRSHRV